MLYVYYLFAVAARTCTARVFGAVTRLPGGPRPSEFIYMYVKCAKRTTAAASLHTQLHRSRVSPVHGGGGEVRRE